MVCVCVVFVCVFVFRVWIVVRLFGFYVGVFGVCFVLWCLYGVCVGVFNVWSVY